MRHAATIGVVIAVLFAREVVVAQPLGTFRWQLAPFCNIVTLAVTQNAGVFEVEGTDDQCGAVGTQASAIGTAFINADGSVGIGVNIISTPGGLPVHVDATITVATLGGTWRDSAGNTGSFVLTPGVNTGGSPRPAPTSSISPGSVGSVQVNPSQVQVRIGGSCPAGSFMQTIEQSGNVVCGASAGTITSVTPLSGLVGGGSSGGVTIGIGRLSTGSYLFENNDGFVARGTINVGSLGTTGLGTRVVWYPRKAAFRAGSVNGPQWDDPAIGLSSVAMGANTTATGARSLAMGDATQALGDESVALGRLVTAGAHGSVVLGSHAATTPAATGTFIFADRSTNADFIGNAANEFGVRAAGGIYLHTSANLSTGCSLPSGSGTLSCTSDRNSKERFEPVDGELVLTKLRAMPIERWSYKSETGVSHVGPVAQDFHAAFGLGVDDKTIGHLDSSGIALRAIQALEARTRELMQENAALKARLHRLEAKER